MTERLPSPRRPNARQRDSTYQTGQRCSDKRDHLCPSAFRIARHIGRRPSADLRGTLLALQDTQAGFLRETHLSGGDIPSVESTVEYLSRLPSGLRELGDYASIAVGDQPSPSSVCGRHPISVVGGGCRPLCIPFSLPFPLRRCNHRPWSVPAQRFALGAQGGPILGSWQPLMAAPRAEQHICTYRGHSVTSLLLAYLNGTPKGLTKSRAFAILYLVSRLYWWSKAMFTERQQRGLQIATLSKVDSLVKTRFEEVPAI